MNLALSAVEVTEARSQVHQVLLGRRHAIANDWHRAIARTGFVPFKAAEVRQRLVQLTEEVIALLLTEPFEHHRAEAIGASLAGLHYVEPEALGRTQEVLGRQLVEGLPAEQVGELQPRLAALLGGLATGFSRRARETVLAEQEWIHGAQARELRRVGEALRKAYDEVEQQVQERTAELRAANESLRRAIMERERAEEALRNAAHQWHATFDAISDAVCLLDLEGRILRCNKAMTKLLGKPFGDIVGHTCWELVHGMSEPIEGCPVVRMRETWHRETLVLPRSDRWFHISADPVLDEGGNLTAAVHILSDITERRRAEEALRESEETARVLLNVPTYVAALVDTRGIILDVNETMAQRLGKPVEELIGVCGWDLIPPDVAERRKAYADQAIQSGKPIRFEDERDGVCFDNVFYPVLDTHGKVAKIALLAGDITERKRAEEELERYRHHLKELVEERTAELRNEIAERKRTEAALKASEERYRSLFEGVPVGLYRTTLEGQILDANSALVQMLGYPDRESLLALNATDLYLDPDDRRREQSLLEHEGVVRDFEMQVRRQDGRSTWVRDTARAACDADGRVLYYEGSLEDITERKQVEEYMLRTERLAAMGRLAAALAHEINNPLQAIGNSLELALDFPLPEKERQEYLQAARREIERLMLLTDRVLNFARPPLVERQVTSVADVVRHALALVSKELHNSDIRVSLDLPDVVPPVLTSSSHLLQVFLNLMINAIEAMPDGGELSIIVRLAGNQVEVIFADSGPGIPPEAMARLFEPFHTTKKNGTGLGLATSHSIIQQHGGTITAGNAPSGGAVFTVALPVAPLDEPYVTERS